MYELKFSVNYRDLSQSTGISAGFQFEFFCECCGDAWCTRFKPYRSGQIFEWLSRAAGVFCGKVARAGSGWPSARKAAFAEAVHQAQWHFRQCASCLRRVCVRCAGGGNGTCSRCVSILSVTSVLRPHKRMRGLPEPAMVEGVARVR